MQNLFARLVFKYGFHFVNLTSDKSSEIDLFIKSLRGVSGVKMIYWRGNNFIAQVFVLGNANKVEFAVRDLFPRFDIKMARVRIGAF